MIFERFSFVNLSIPAPRLDDRRETRHGQVSWLRPPTEQPVKLVLCRLLSIGSARIISSSPPAVHKNFHCPSTKMAIVASREGQPAAAQTLPGGGSNTPGSLPQRPHHFARGRCPFAFEANGMRTQKRGNRHLLKVIKMVRPTIRQFANPESYTKHPSTIPPFHLSTFPPQNSPHCARFAHDRHASTTYSLRHIRRGADTHDTRTPFRLSETSVQVLHKT